MKKFLFILLIVVTFSSCDNAYIKGGKSLINKDEETTLAVLNKIDTTKTYYVVLDKNTLVAVNTQTRVVEHKTIDSSGLLMTFFLMILVLFSAFIFILNINL